MTNSLETKLKQTQDNQQIILQNDISVYGVYAFSDKHGTMVHMSTSLTPSPYSFFLTKPF